MRRKERLERRRRRDYKEEMQLSQTFPPLFKLFLEGNCWEDGRVDSGRAICTIVELFMAESARWRRRYRAHASVRKRAGTSVLRWPWNVSLAPCCITVCTPEMPLKSWLQWDLPVASDSTTTDPGGTSKTESGGASRKEPRRTSRIEPGQSSRTDPGRASRT